MDRGAAVRRRRPDDAPNSTAVATLEPDVGVPRERRRLGDLLVEAGAVGRDSVEAAAARGRGFRIGTTLVERGLVDEATLTDALGRQLEVPVVDLRDAKPAPAATTLVRGTDAHQLDILPLSLDGDVLHVAVADPLNAELLALLRGLPVERVSVALGVPSHLRNRVNQTYRALSAVQTDIDAFRSNAHSIADVAVPEEVADQDAPIVQVVNKIVTEALRDRASDVHIEPRDDGVGVRFRIDGALKEIVSLPSEMAPALVSRIKIMAEMNIVERRRPQDGQFEMMVDGRALDVRVSTTSTIWGEKAVLRLLDRKRSLLQLGDLGMPPSSGDRYTRIVGSPFGMVIVAGPTGSGKTTTLYATLSEINRPDMNVMTIEDPVEYVFPKVNQIQISEQAGLTFATGLKSILRQDPDVILVGEVRDVETARIAVQSALTGHLVLSSVHAIDSVSALYRLLDMGIESFRVTSAIVGVVAQRLVRRICQSCAAPYEPSSQEQALFRKLGGEKDVWLRGQGCTICAGTGYFERLGVFEVLTMSDEIRQSLVDGVAPRATRGLAIEQGMRSLQTEAMRLVAANVTTLDEVVRHVFGAEGSL
jgi:type IV pilus assembly protein PilB